MEKKKLLPILLPIVPAAALFIEKTVEALFTSKIEYDLKRQSGRYKLLMHYANGESDFLDETFDSEEEATKAGETVCSEERLGYEIFHDMNPGDNPYNEDEFQNYFEIIEI